MEFGEGYFSRFLTDDLNASSSFEHDTRFVRCKFADTTFVVNVQGSVSYRGLWEVIRNNCSEMEGLKLKMGYVINEGPLCVLRNDKDVAIMFKAQVMVGAEFVDVTIENDIPVNEGRTVSSELSFGGNLPDSQLVGVNFIRSHRALLSEAWRFFIVEVDQRFEEGVDEFRDKLCMYAAIMGFDYDLVRNDKLRVTTECMRRFAEGCNWRVHASICTATDAFVIRTLNNVHTCSGRVRKSKGTVLTSRVISRLVEGEIRSNPEFSTKDVVNHVRTCYGFEVPYTNAYYAREIARKKVLGDDVTSYNKLVRYVELVKESYPGSYCVMEVEEKSRRFEMFFVAFGSAIQGFMFCRPVLYIDGTFLKNKFKGTLLVATGKDANNGMYPLAFAIVGSETQCNWEWFLGHLPNVLRGQEREITFLSDRNPGLLNAVRMKFPGYPHGYCMHHMRANLLLRFAGSENTDKRARAEKLFLRCAYAPTKERFHYNLKKLVSLDKKKICAFLKGAAFSNWANAYFIGERFGDMCSNVAESFNSWIRVQRNLPIYEMVDGIRVKMMELISRRADESKKWTSFLCPKMEKKLVEKSQEGRTFGIVKANDREFEVDDGGKLSVDIEERTCDCQNWRIEGFPCSHAAAVLVRGGMDVYKYVDPYFYASTFKCIYSFSLHPITVPEFAEPSEPSPLLVLPPLTKRQAGRPKLKRFQKRIHAKRLMTCSRCGKKAGHNRKTCNEEIGF